MRIQHVSGRHAVTHRSWVDNPRQLPLDEVDTDEHDNDLVPHAVSPYTLFLTNK
jgi:hypothetical protein